MSIAILRRGHQEQRNENVWPTGEKSKESISRCVGRGAIGYNFYDYSRLLALVIALTFQSIKNTLAPFLGRHFFTFQIANREAKVKLGIAASGALSLFMNTFKLSLAFGKSGLARRHDALRLSFESTVRRTALC